MNRTVQTGPKTQLGGLKLGLLIVVYQEETDDDVKKEPMNPAPRQTTTDIASLI